MIQATFAFASSYRPESRIFADDLAGGGILDVGGYPVSMARLIAGAATGQPFADPATVTAVRPSARPAPTSGRSRRCSSTAA